MISGVVHVCWLEVNIPIKIQNRLLHRLAFRYFREDGALDWSLWFFFVSSLCFNQH